MNKVIPFSNSYSVTIQSKTYEIDSEREETNFLKNLSSTLQVLALNTNAVTKPGKARFYQQIDKYFATKLTRDGTLLCPKIVKDVTNGNLHKITFVNGIREEYLRGDPVRKRVYPDGTIEDGTFDPQSLQLWSGYRFGEGKFTYLRPEVLDGLSVSLYGEVRVKFARVPVSTTSFAKEVKLVQGEDPEFTLYEGSPFEILLRFGQSFSTPNYAKMVNYLERPWEFIEFVFKPDDRGFLPVSRLSEQALLEVLNMAKLFEIEKVNLHALFSEWVGRGSEELLKRILELDPTAIQELGIPKHRGVIAQTFWIGLSDKVALLLGAAIKQKVKLHDEDEWIRRAVDGDTSFSDEEFLRLTPNMQESVYRIANMHCYEELLLRLNKLLKIENEEAIIEGPTLIAQNRDFTYSKKAIQTYLQELRTRQLLFREEEFQIPDSWMLQQRDVLSRMIGRDFVQQKTREKGWKYIKTPNSLVVIEKGTKSLTASIVVLENGYLKVEIEQLKLYSEKIEKVDRELSVEEADELLQALEELSFRDAHPGNFIIAKDGLYFIDFELVSFVGIPNLSEWKQLTKLVNLDYRPIFESKLIEAFERCTKAIRKYESSMRETRQNNLKKFGFQGISPFTLQI